jgi:hypothetical protein
VQGNVPPHRDLGKLTGQDDECRHSSAHRSSDSVSSSPTIEIWTKHFGHEMAEKLCQLQRLADDPVRFAVLRREILQQHMEQIPAERRAFVALLQEQVDHHRSECLTPARTFSFLIQSIDDCVEAVIAVGRRIVS